MQMQDFVIGDEYMDSTVMTGPVHPRIEFHERDTCKYHLEKGGVACEAVSRKPGECERCGWNPLVSRRRLWRMRKIWKEVGF